MRLFPAVVFLVSLFAPIVQAETAASRADAPFDFYVMRIVWTPSLCADSANADPRCEASVGGFALDGLMPSFEAAQPSFCLQGSTAPSRRYADEMSDIMHSGDWAWYQWKKHGSCSGLAGEEYFDAARRAYASIVSPPSLETLDREVEVPLQAITDTMLQINPDLPVDGISVTCQNGRMHEMVICFDPNLHPRACAPAIRRGCQQDMVNITPIVH
ncbi:MAG: ribonuclease T [Pseudomonadota bacterium]